MKAFPTESVCPSGGTNRLSHLSPQMTQLFTFLLSKHEGNHNCSYLKEMSELNEMVNMKMPSSWGTYIRGYLPPDSCLASIPMYNEARLMLLLVEEP